MRGGSFDRFEKMQMLREAQKKMFKLRNSNSTNRKFRKLLLEERVEGSQNENTEFCWKNKGFSDQFKLKYF